MSVPVKATVGQAVNAIVDGRRCGQIDDRAAISPPTVHRRFRMIPRGSIGCSGFHSDIS